ncbi:MAG: prepilin-type N-terminal cleavage/methylation domain-containing protein [Acidobacteriota bacterium]
MAAVTRQRGFSLVELLVASVLLLAALAIASRLVLDAQASIAHSGRRVLDMSVDQAFDQLRYDVRSSNAFLLPSGLDDLWVRDEPLQLSGHFSGESVTYELLDGELLRHSVPPGPGATTTTRPLLRNVRLFRYRTVDGTGRPSIEVEVTYSEAGPLTARAGAGQASAGGVERVVGLVVTPRHVTQTDPVGWW